jgi:hypothetical protein
VIFAMLNANRIVGTHDLLLVTLDTLRLDVAESSWRQGKTPNLAKLLPPTGWEARHSPASFTYAAHQAFFAGFFPTPVAPGKHPRLFALEFPGSETIAPETCVLDAPDIITGLANRGYHTVCVGGVGFFNKISPLGRVLPGMFAESYWEPALGVTHPDSTENQVELGLQILRNIPAEQRLLMFVNISALHQPNCCYVDGATSDSVETQQAALAYVDQQLPRLITEMSRRSPLLCILTSDHGTAYGEDGYWGHRLSHPVVWNVPYAEILLE